MTYTVLFIITLIVVSGAIAYLGDLLGRRLGKRRLTLFGLRPRHTAIVVTTITGMLIAGVVFATLITVSASLREVLLRGERLINDIEIYQSKNTELSEKNKLLAEGNKSLQTRNKSLLSTRSKLALEVEKKADEVDQAIRARDEARKRVDELQSDIRKSQIELERLRQSGKATEENLSRMTASLEDKKAELKVVRLDLEAKEKDLSVKLQELVAKDIELNKMDLMLKEKERSIKDAETTIARHENTIETQKEQLMEAVQFRDTYFTGDVVLSFGQEIIRKVIDSSQSPEQIRTQLIGLFDEADAQVKRMHPELKQETRVIRLAVVDTEKKVVLFPRNDNDINTIIDKHVKAIVGIGHSLPDRGVIVRLVVVKNTLRDEIAPVEINLYPNRLTFSQGQKIASRIIDGKLSEGRILLEVMDFLGQNVRMAAQSAGVQPVASPNPDEVDEPISGAQLDEIMELVEMIRAGNKKVEVYARAEKDIYAAGPISLDNIEFIISEITTSASR
ncbi:MAG TPA: DUF3084 domain-containing protein [Armatimonadota bacterium]|mgnify:CR=1 FL=1|nr:DUF3084 domain-containing protein [Armatimonadota bacterium]HOM71928.1 DUF3084 domain-containing protein [Armatimonadota bacterium]